MSRIVAFPNGTVFKNDKMVYYSEMWQLDAWAEKAAHDAGVRGCFSESGTKLNSIRERRAVCNAV